MRGLTFNGEHSLIDMRLTMPNDPQIQFPEKNKRKLRIPGTNHFYDYDQHQNLQEYSEREIRCTFNIINFDSIDIAETHKVASRLLNWLMSPVGKSRLELDIIPHFYFLAEVESVSDFETDLFEIGEIEVIFIAEPFKKSTHPEGNALWDAFNFRTDVLQKVKYDLVGTMEKQMDYIDLKIGDMVTIGGWALYRRSHEAGTDPLLKHYETEPFYEIIDKRERTVDMAKGLFSRQEYQIDNGYWILEQDIVQARSGHVPIKLINVSTHPIIPRIKHHEFEKPNTWIGITIERDGNYYNFRFKNEKQTEFLNDSFALNPGENNLKVYGQNNSVEFIWHKEVL